MAKRQRRTTKVSKRTISPKRSAAKPRKRDNKGRFISKRKQFFNRTAKTRQQIRDYARKRSKAKTKSVKSRFANKIKDLLKNLKKAASRIGVQNVKVKGESSGKSSQKGVKTKKTSVIRKAKGSAKVKARKTNRRQRKSPRRK